MTTAVQNYRTRSRDDYRNDDVVIYNTNALEIYRSNDTAAAGEAVAWAAETRYDYPLNPDDRDNSATFSKILDRLNDDAPLTNDADSIDHRRAYCAEFAEISLPPGAADSQSGMNYANSLFADEPPRTVNFWHRKAIADYSSEHRNDPAPDAAGLDYDIREEPLKYQLTWAIDQLQSQTENEYTGSDPMRYAQLLAAEQHYVYGLTAAAGGADANQYGAPGDPAVAIDRYNQYQTRLANGELGINEVDFDPNRQQGLNPDYLQNTYDAISRLPASDDPIVNDHRAITLTHINDAQHTLQQRRLLDIRPDIELRMGNRYHRSLNEQFRVTMSAIDDNINGPA